MPIDVTCAVCGEPFKVPPSHHSATRGRYCGAVCAGIAKRQPPTLDSLRARTVEVLHDPELGPCWEWQGAHHKRGYGLTTLAVTHGKRQKWYVHRLVWTFVHGEIPEGLNVLHRCDNPPCCNPAHLFLGTLAENCADRHAKGRTHKGETASLHRLTEAQVREIRQIAAAGVQGFAVSRSAIGRRYGVARATIDDVVNRVTWKHVP
jgi:hypothetical protein